MGKDRTSMFTKTSVEVKYKKEVYVFNALKSLDLSTRNLKDMIDEHTREYYLWRALRDRVRAELRRKKLEYEVQYNSKFFEASMQFTNNGITPSKQMIMGFIETSIVFPPMRVKIYKLEESLDKLDSVVYALEHRKQMLYLASQV